MTDEVSRMDRVVPISETRAKLGELVDETREHEVYLLCHGHPVAVLVDAETYGRILDHIEDLEDRLAIVNAPGDTVPFERSGDVAHAV